MLKGIEYSFEEGVFLLWATFVDLPRVLQFLKLDFDGVVWADCTHHVDADLLGPSIADQWIRPRKEDSTPRGR